jgi:hypothetical protein
VRAEDFNGGGKKSIKEIFFVLCALALGTKKIV